MFDFSKQIPSGWKYVPLKYLVVSNNDTLSENTSSDYEFDYIDIGSVTYGKGIEQFQHMYFKDAPSRARRIVKKNDVILSTVRTYLKATAQIPEWEYPIIVSTGFLTLTSNEEKINPQYLKYAIQFDGFISEIESRSKGISYPAINSTEAVTVKVVLPPLKTQIAISKLLDKKCNEIDALSADIQIEIDTLEEYKRSIIIETVTKGLNKNTLMQESGIDFVGKIPSHWEIHPVYYYFGERKTKNYTLKEQNLLSLSFGKIIRKDINTNGGLLPASFNTYNIVEANDIIIRPTDLQNDKRSLRTGLVTEHGIITSAYIDLKPIGNINSKFFHYLLHAYDVMKVFYNMGNGVRQGLNYGEFSKLMIFSPPRQEQDEIVDYLDGKCVQIEEIIALKREQLSVLEDYKKSIIYEYVLGKKEVPLS